MVDPGKSVLTHERPCFTQRSQYSPRKNYDRPREVSIHPFAAMVDQYTNFSYPEKLDSVGRSVGKKNVGDHCVFLRAVSAFKMYYLKFDFDLFHKNGKYQGRRSNGKP